MRPIRDNLVEMRTNRLHLDDHLRHRVLHLGVIGHGTGYPDGGLFFDIVDGPVQSALRQAIVDGGEA